MGLFVLDGRYFSISLTQIGQGSRYILFLGCFYSIYILAREDFFDSNWVRDPSVYFVLRVFLLYNYF